MTKTEELIGRLYTGHASYTIGNGDLKEAADTIKQLVELVRLQHNALELAYSFVDDGIGLMPVDSALAAFDRFEKGEE